VTAAARSAGHWISFILTSVLMSVLITVLYREALTARGALNRVERWGPLMMLLVAIPLILADPTRHLLGDYHIWEGCGNNRVYSRINSSNAFPG